MLLSFNVFHLPLSLLKEGNTFLAPVEKRAYQDSMEQIGASNYWLIEHQNKVSDEEIRILTK